MTQALYDSNHLNARNLNALVATGIVLGAGVLHGFSNARGMQLEEHSKVVLTYGPSIFFGVYPTAVVGCVLSKANSLLPQEERVSNSSLLKKTATVGAITIGASALVNFSGYFVGYLAGVFSK